ncbi:MAG: aminotransferase class I/II-fold pyridoxal phosphate-dependent enzyme [Acholeplasmataceae bacterium]|jgi:aspartate/tyrosine/aromatic aminotransferase|nr:aminotransferase class I/II-fold pyridoxal phosphate-dependent enzyme [Acholeplasmataceae bacterium]MDD4194179.1 aminotransferase class I/II-fold pyridoxal phosphate-dependent enzyme [Acholeplasmataceae bacterium]MDY0338768.1 aminotransferase class I/II-fold pyridoxal phosphate-dependent enzyme [Acholeplasmataceae bacterium]
MAVDILKISKDARDAKKIYNDVIDASIGMFFDEDKSIGGMPSVSKAIRELSDDQILPYPSVDGGPGFKKDLISWVLGKYEDEIKKTMYVDACATPGGSGAIASTFSIMTKPKDYIFVSDVRWQYERFADRAKLNIFEHKLFDGDAFNLQSFKERLDALCAIQHRVVVIVNDPCHNPTGYTLTLDEFNKIIDILNSKTENEIIFLYDVAYLEFTHEEDNRLKMSYLPKLKEHVMTIVTFSGSKTFGVYGLRMGAAIILSKNKDQVADAHKKYVNEARGSWSATPTISIELFNHFAKPENKKVFLKDLARLNDIVQKRSMSFNEQAKEIGLVTYPFRSGFYTVVLTDNPDQDYLKLQEHHIYAVPMNGGIRLALCSLSIHEIQGLPSKIKSILNL